MEPSRLQRTAVYGRTRCTMRLVTTSRTAWKGRKHRWVHARFAILPVNATARGPCSRQGPPGHRTNTHVETNQPIHSWCSQPSSMGLASSTPHRTRTQPTNVNTQIPNPLPHGARSRSAWDWPAARPAAAVPHSLRMLPHTLTHTPLTHSLVVLAAVPHGVGQQHAQLPQYHIAHGCYHTR